MQYHMEYGYDLIESIHVMWNVSFLHCGIFFELIRTYSYNDNNNDDDDDYGDMAVYDIIINPPCHAHTYTHAYVD